MIRVGIIGASPERSWAALAHVPALKALSDYKITAISTTRKETANAAARAYGAALAFDKHEELVAHPEVDLVVVCVKVPHHFSLVLAALDAGKHVYCEWPLGVNLEEAITMTERAEMAGVRTAVGLQARSSPTITYVKDLIRGGYVGGVLSTTLVGTGMRWGAELSQHNAYLANKANGATMLSIPFGHTVDAMCLCLGEFASLNATLAVRRKTATVVETGEVVQVTSDDQVAVSGILTSGAVASIHYRGGTVRGHNLLWEIVGTEGELHLTSESGNAQMFPLSLSGARAGDKALKPLSLPPEYTAGVVGLPTVVATVACAYRLFANDIRTGSKSIPDFADAVVRHRMLATIEKAAQTGERQKLSD